MAEVILCFEHVMIPIESIFDDPSKVVVEIYKIKCLVSGKQYVGQAVSHILNHGRYRRYGSEGRFRCHVSEAITDNKKKQCRYLNNAIRKYGPEQFIVDVIGVCTKTMADAWETSNIQYYKTMFPKGYNLKLGGQNFVHTEVSRIRVSKGVQKYAEDARFSRYKDRRIAKDCNPHKVNSTEKVNNTVGMCYVGTSMVFKSRQILVV